MNKKEVAQIYDNIELDLHCVVWLTDKKRRLLENIIYKRFKLAGVKK